MKVYRYVLITSIIFNAIFLGFLISKRMYFGYIKYLNSHPTVNDSLVTYTINKYKNNNDAVALFKMLPHDTSDIVFLGTSLTQGFPLQEIFNNSRIKNRGIGGNTTVDILNRIKEVTDGKPRKIFIEVGTNDIAHNLPNNLIFNNLKKIIDSIKLNSPLSKIYIQSVLPFGRDKNKKIKAYNNLVAIYCLQNKITYIDLYPYFVQGDAMNESLTTDGTHLNGYGYILWKSHIDKFVL